VSSACLSWRPSWIQASAALSSAASIPASSVTRFLPSLTRRRFSAASAESERFRFSGGGRPSAVVAGLGDGRRSVRTERSVEGPAERSVGSVPTRRSTALLLWAMARGACTARRGHIFVRNFCLPEVFWGGNTRTCEIRRRSRRSLYTARNNRTRVMRCMLNKVRHETTLACPRRKPTNNIWLTTWHARLPPR